MPDATPYRYADRDGYVRLRWKVAPCQYVEVREHRVIDGVVTTADHVHHLNGVRGDNRRDNLLPVGISQHGAIHSGRRFSRIEARALYETGLGTPEIGRLLGVGGPAVYRALRAEGVALRQRGSSTAWQRARLSAAQRNRWEQATEKERDDHRARTTRGWVKRRERAGL